jgi:hypothetical protein
VIARRKQDQLRNRVNKVIDQGLLSSVNMDIRILRSMDRDRALRAAIEDEKQKAFANGFSTGVLEGERREAARRGGLK